MSTSDESKQADRAEGAGACGGGRSGEQETGQLEPSAVTSSPSAQQQAEPAAVGPIEGRTSECNWRYLAASLAVIVGATVAFWLIFPQIRLHVLSDDVYYHLVVARDMMDKGDYLLELDDWFLAPDARPHVYPPLFHWLLVSLHRVTGTDLETLCVDMQGVFFPVALLAFLLLARAILSQRAAFIGLAILATTFPFAARTSLAIPEALELVLLSLVLWAYVRRKEWAAGAILAVAVVLHIATPFLLAGGLALHQVWVRRKNVASERRRLWPVMLGLLPGLLLQGYFAYINYGIPRVDADKLRPTLWWVLRAYFNPLFGVRSILVPLGLGLWGFHKLRERPFVRLCISLTAALCVILVTYSARFSSYALIPLCIVTGLLLDLWIARGIRLAVAARLGLLLLLNIPASFVLFKYNFDYIRPKDTAVEVLMRDSGELVPQDQSICVKELFDAYRVAWYTGRHSTLLDLGCGDSKFLYLRGDQEAPEGWQLVFQRETHRLFYHRAASPDPAAAQP